MYNVFFMKFLIYVLHLIITYLMIVTIKQYNITSPIKKYAEKETEKNKLHVYFFRYKVWKRLLKITLQFLFFLMLYERTPILILQNSYIIGDTAIPQWESPVNLDKKYKWYTKIQPRIIYHQLICMTVMIHKKIRHHSPQKGQCHPSFPEKSTHRNAIQIDFTDFLSSSFIILFYLF
jgi:hypothetical protein